MSRRNRSWIIVLSALAFTTAPACGDGGSHGSVKQDGSGGDGDGDIDARDSGHDTAWGPDGSLGDGDGDTPGDGDGVDAGGGDACTTNCSPACSDACPAAAATRCEANAVSICQTGADGCLAWGTPAACAADQFCNGDTCGGCPAGDLQCNAAGDVERCNSTGSALLFASDCAESCTDGLCVGACKPGAKRCQDGKVAQCSGSGNAWNVIETCSTTCDEAWTTCTVANLDITTNTTLDGVKVVTGTVHVRSGATLSVPSGSLRLRANSIVVEAGGAIVVSPDPSSTGLSAGLGLCAGNGGGNGTAGEVPETSLYCSSVPSTDSAKTSLNDVSITAGNRGSSGSTSGNGTGGVGGLGGGRLELFADSITIHGSLSAKGQGGGTGTLGSNSLAPGGGGGAGGGILIVADQLAGNGTISVAGGAGGTGIYQNPQDPLAIGATGGNGGLGRVKLIYGSSNTFSGTVTGVKQSGLMPPLTVTSTNFPDPALFYNDDVAAVELSWSRPFPSVQGYVHKLDILYNSVPTDADEHTANEHVSIPLDSFPTESTLGGIGVPGIIIPANTAYFHIASRFDDKAGTFASHFKISINRLEPKLTYNSGDYDVPSDRSTLLVNWDYPRDAKHFQGVRWVVDHYGDTLPALTDKTEKDGSTIPIISIQRTLYVEDIPSGLWAMHMVTIDTQGRRTKQAAHLVFRAGPLPGSANLGGVVSHAGTPVPNAKVRINRDLIGPAQTTQAQGQFTFEMVPAGKWEIEVSAEGYQTKTSSVTVVSGIDKMVDLSL